jgi:hypothetical protein
LGTVKTSVDDIAHQVIAGFEEVLKMDSPYPNEYQEVVYQAMRYGLGSGFDELLTPDVVHEIVDRFNQNGTL